MQGARARSYQEDRATPTKLAILTSATTLTLNQRVVRATVNTTYDSYTVTLPSVTEAAGLVFTIQVTVANSKALTLVDQDDSEDWSDLTFDTDADAAVLYSDGRKWWVILNDIA